MSFHRTTGSAVGLDATVQAIQDYLVSTVGWTLEQNGTINDGTGNRPWWALSSTGESGTRQFYVRMYCAHLDALAQTNCTGLLQLWASRCYNCACCFCDQPDSPYKCCAMLANRCGWQSIPSIAVKSDDTITYWICADLDCFVIIMKSGTPSAYGAGFFGLVSQYRDAASDPHPLLAVGSGDSGIYSDWTFQSLWPFATTCCCGLARWQMRSLADNSWCCLFCASDAISPLSPALLMMRWRNKENQPHAASGCHTINPIIVGTAPSSDGFRGEMKFCYQVSRRGLLPETIITAGGNDYKVFPMVTTNIDAGHPDPETWLALRDYD